MGPSNHSNRRPARRWRWPVSEASGGVWQRWVAGRRGRLTRPCAPDGHAVAVPHLPQLAGMPGSGQDVGEEHHLVVGQARGHLEAVCVGCKQGGRGAAKAGEFQTVSRRKTALLLRNRAQRFESMTRTAHGAAERDSTSQRGGLPKGTRAYSACPPSQPPCG